MKTILRNYYFLLVMILLLGFVGKAFAEQDPPEMSAVDPISKREITFVGLPLRPALTDNHGIGIGGLYLKWENVADPTAETRDLWNNISPNQDAMSLVKQVNAWVNSHIESKDDDLLNVNTGDRNDKWDDVNVSLKRGYGDCEDIAIAKYQILKDLGFPEDSLYLIAGNDIVGSKKGHVFLLVRIGNHSYLLDNNSNEVFTDKRVLFVEFYPLSAYSRQHSWVFGIRKN